MMGKKFLRVIFILILGLIGGIFADQVFCPYFIERPLFYKYRLEQAPVYVTEKNEIVVQENTALQDAVDKVKRVIVGVRAETRKGKVIEGSGLVITSDGLVVTLASIIPQGETLAFFLDGDPVSFQVLKRDSKKDLALVLIAPEGKSLPTIAFGDIGKTRLGERVFLVGNVFGENGIEKTVNSGIIKNLYSNFIRTNILEENFIKGSALFNIKGEALGLNTLNSAGEVVAIPIDQIKEFTGF